MANSKYQILVSGSLAYDVIMDFPGKFSDHIMPEKIHALNVSFFLASRHQEFGGTAGNIAYNLALLGLQPMILASAGNDFEKYRTWLEHQNIDLSLVKIVTEEPTAVAHIMTDQADNQITGFYPGAMRFAAANKFQITNSKLQTNSNDQIQNSKPITDYGLRVTDYDLAIVSPGNLDDMRTLPAFYCERNIPYIYDPGQAITGLSGEDLLAGINGARFLICNDYEAALITQKSGFDCSRIAGSLEAIIVTRGAEGVELITTTGREIIPAAKSDAVADPTGAGDAFRAGFIAGLMRGDSLQDACRLGATVAVYTVEKRGTQTHTFTPDELQKRYEANYSAHMIINR